MEQESSANDVAYAAKLWQHFCIQAGDDYRHLLVQLVLELNASQTTFQEFAVKYRDAWGHRSTTTANPDAPKLH